MAQPIDPNYAAWLASQQAQQAPQAPQAPQAQQIQGPAYGVPQAPQYPGVQYQAPQQAYQPPAAQPAPAAYQMHIPTNVQIDTTPPPPMVGGKGPRMQDMAGRLVLISPTKIERGVVNTLAKVQPGQPPALQDRLTCDIVLFGQPIAYGGKPEQGIPHTLMANCPSEWPARFISGKLIVGQLESKLPERTGTGQPGFLLGVLERNPNPNAAPGQPLSWKLGDPSPAQIQEAQAFLAARAAGQVQATPPTPGAPAQAYTTYANSAQGVNAPQQYQQAPAPQYAPQQPAMDTAYAAFLASQQQHSQSAPVQWQQPYQAPPPAAPPAPVLDLNTPPSNFDPNVWVTLAPEVRTQILQSSAAPTHWG